jgi:hypothetical protein
MVLVKVVVRSSESWLLVTLFPPGKGCPSSWVEREERWERATERERRDREGCGHLNT